eukprot:gene42716-biopygen120382
MVNEEALHASKQISGAMTSRHNAHAFFCFAQSKDQLGRCNLVRVSKMYERLREVGLTCFDPAQTCTLTAGDVCTAMEQSKAVIVCITRSFLLRASGKGHHGTDDMCWKEFDYVCNSKGIARALPVVMEPSCRRTNEWRGIVGMNLGGVMYVDLADEDDVSFDKGMAHLEKELLRIAAIVDKADRSPSKQVPSPAAAQQQRQKGTTTNAEFSEFLKKHELVQWQEKLQNDGIHTIADLADAAAEDSLSKEIPLSVRRAIWIQYARGRLRRRQQTSSPITAPVASPTVSRAG